jgi:LysM repeat protein
MVKDCDNVLLKEKKIASISYVSSAQIKTEFDDEAQISADSPSINRIINTFSNAIEEESKIVENKMLVKSKVSVSVLYLTDSSTYERFEKTIAVNSILDIQGAAENDIAFNELTLSNIYVKPKADKNNQYRSFEIIGEMIINSAVYRDTELTLPVDAYSIKNTAKPEFSRLSLNSEYSVINDSITEKFVINSDKQSITRVLDLSAAVFSDNSIEISAFIADENNNISLISSRNKTELSGFNEISINILSADYVIISENELEVRINMAYKALKYNSETVEVINKVEIAESAPIASPALTVYFAESGEEIWDIAKRFKTSKELIKKENELTKETIDSKRILIIPGM